MGLWWGGAALGGRSQFFTCLPDDIKSFCWAQSQGQGLTSPFIQPWNLERDLTQYTQTRLHSEKGGLAQQSSLGLPPLQQNLRKLPSDTAYSNA